jgi:hypothetical protein
VRTYFVSLVSHRSIKQRPLSRIMETHATSTQQNHGDSRNTTIAKNRGVLRRILWIHTCLFAYAAAETCRLRFAYPAVHMFAHKKTKNENASLHAQLCLTTPDLQSTQASCKQQMRADNLHTYPVVGVTSRLQNTSDFQAAAMISLNRPKDP